MVASCHRNLPDCLNGIVRQRWTELSNRNERGDARSFKPLKVFGRRTENFDISDFEEIAEYKWKLRIRNKIYQKIEDMAVESNNVSSFDGLC